MALGLPGVVATRYGLTVTTRSGAVIYVNDLDTTPAFDGAPFARRDVMAALLEGLDAGAWPDATAWQGTMWVILGAWGRLPANEQAAYWRGNFIMQSPIPIPARLLPPHPDPRETDTRMGLVSRIDDATFEVANLQASVSLLAADTPADEARAVSAAKALLEEADRLDAAQAAAPIAIDHAEARVRTAAARRAALAHDVEAARVAVGR